MATISTIYIPEPQTRFSRNLLVNRRVVESDCRLDEQELRLVMAMEMLRFANPNNFKPERSMLPINVGVRFVTANLHHLQPHFQRAPVSLANR